MMNLFDRRAARVRRGRSVASLQRVLTSAVILALSVGLAGCESSPEEYDNVIDGSAAATFTGDRYLRGTIGSYGSYVNNKPQYVAGYGMVVDLNGTGSNEVPGFMREWLANEIRRNRLGSLAFGTEGFGPERVMADLGSSVVAVEGLIPPGAAKGSKFDLLVTMIDQTSTSLAGGRLFWPTQLSPTGLDRRLIYTQTLGAGYGELFVNPIRQEGESETEFLRQGVIVNGGTVLVPQQVEFVLNQPSARIASAIADRINARFESADTDNLPTAVAKQQGAVVEINVPARFSRQPEELLALIEQLYLDPTPNFVRPQAQALGKALEQDPAGRADQISKAWKMLGPNTKPILRNYYNSEDADIRRAALEAGSWLNDEQSTQPLVKIAMQGEPLERIWATRCLVTLRRSAAARGVVRGLLNDPDPAVRLGAYEALNAVGDGSIDRLSVEGETGHKFFIDRVRSDYPMVHAIQGDEQAIVIFGGDVPLRKNAFATLGDSLTMRTLPTDSITVGLSGRIAGQTAFIPIHRCGALQMIPSLTPVSDDPEAKLPPPDWRVEVGDNAGNSMLLNIRDAALQDQFGVKLLNIRGRDTPTDDPRALAMIRIVQDAGQDEDGRPTPAVGELLQLRGPDAQLPVALRYRPPGDREAVTYRVTPTIATLAYTLGYHVDNINTKTGPDLSFSEVVQALYRLSEQNQIPAPFSARISPLAQAIVYAQNENRAEPRPEITPEEFERLQQERGIDTEPDADQDPALTPDGRPDGGPSTLPITFGNDADRNADQRPDITPGELERPRDQPTIPSGSGK